MFRASLIALTVASAVYAEPPKQSDVAWAWNGIECKDGICTNRQQAVIWAWSKVVARDAGRLPASQCGCANGCNCCQTGTCNCNDGECEKMTQQEWYLKLRDLSIKHKKPLLVAVGVSPPVVKDTFSCRWDEFPGVKSGIIVGVPSGNDLIRAADLPASATEAQLRAAIAPPKAVPVQRPG